jgi:hypothetical protein
VPDGGTVLEDFVYYRNKIENMGVSCSFEWFCIVSFSYPCTLHTYNGPGVPVAGGRGVCCPFTPTSCLIMLCLPKYNY